MSEYQLLYLRYLQAKRDFPALNHTGHEPSEVGLYNPSPMLISKDYQGTRWHFARIKPEGQRRFAEREFNRTT